MLKKRVIIVKVSSPVIMENQLRESEKTVSKSDNENDNSNSRKRKRSQSQSSSSGDSESSASKSPSPAKAKARTDSPAVSYAHFEFLSQQMAYLTNILSKNLESRNSNLVVESVPVTSNDFNLRQPGYDKNNKLNILSEVSTTVKDPVYGKSNENFLKKLSDLQRFKCDDWHAIRFADTQKKYLTTPGFVELNVNDELKRFESAMLKEDSRSYLLERSFAGLTNALLTQKDNLQSSLQTLVDWAYDSKELLTPSSLFGKIQDIFSKESAYSKVTDDLLQMVCGRRADLINTRRETLLRHISEEYHRDVLYKIPPSAASLFNDELVQTYLQKIGGAEKLSSLPKPATKTHYKENLFQNPKPATSKQPDNTFFRPNLTSNRGKHASRPSNQPRTRPSNNRDRKKVKKTQGRSSFKDKRRE